MQRQEFNRSKYQQLQQEQEDQQQITNNHYCRTKRNNKCETIIFNCHIHFGQIISNYFRILFSAWELGSNYLDSFIFNGPSGQGPMRKASGSLSFAGGEGPCESCNKYLQDVTQNGGLCFQPSGKFTEKHTKIMYIPLHDSEGKGWQSQIDCRVSSVACFSKLRGLPLSKCRPQNIVKGVLILYILENRRGDVYSLHHDAAEERTRLRG